MSSDLAPLPRTDTRIPHFVQSLAQGDGLEMSAAFAGIPLAYAGALACHPEVIRQLEEAALARLNADLVPLAQKTAGDIMRDEKTDASVKARVALGVLDLNRRAREAGDGAANRKPIEELTRAELEARLDQVRAQEARLVGSDKA